MAAFPDYIIAYTESDGVVTDYKWTDTMDTEGTMYVRYSVALAYESAEIKRLKKLLAERDKFIVDKGLWSEFVATL